MESQKSTSLWKGRHLIETRKIASERSPGEIAVSLIVDSAFLVPIDISVSALPVQPLVPITAKDSSWYLPSTFHQFPNSLPPTSLVPFSHSSLYVQPVFRSEKIQVRLFIPMRQKGAE